MKKLSALFIMLCCAALMACSQGQKINGHTTKTAYKSVKMLKNRLLPENRIEFEVAFWAIRDANKEDKKFLSLVDGKKPEEIVALGKEIFKERRDAGFKEYTQYGSWEEMIIKFGRERIEQENHKSNKKEDTKDQANDVLYKL